ncbi:MAG: GFA family protein [Tistlia sp.]|uniref:GFA family protein n=1 Tax=Tistlia sp. TaxID=3057121 RepID=UPI0034A1051D
MTGGSRTPRSAGSCLCGAVRFELTAPLRPAVACHCAQCRKTSGHHAVFTAVPLEALVLTEQQGLRWFRSSEQAERGFCGACGSNLFWKRDGSGRLSVAAGNLEQPTGTRLAGHIFTAYKGDYYGLEDGLPSFPEDDGGKLDGDSGTRQA